mmetsp:Transcript_36106/g.88967  ORF Transcript_36106/g.88967 Transcript_36106/m.88967 type:complete len:132 (-) Transcript_36106:52-447(-)|eukprot:CAMPEP_0197603046 /NCGR_PEP_ID=MMETSP1326-20131121/38438_1 /TAXON_ID=1155430 /ORGANISM="Genus nov. species nov., Strain RCC2288" /LENGTH=131 /DNA_ID=CAMNT_0043170499 /DNA_START=42 /DNA_END=437 /DNA_ORIENTATION=-
MAKGSGAERRAGVKELREEVEEEKKWSKKEKKNLIWGINPLHLFFLVLFTLPTIFAVVDYFFNFSKVPGGGYGTLDPAQAVWREKLKAFYGENNPGKMSEIPELLKKYKGKENKLWRKLNAKYDKIRAEQE